MAEQDAVICRERASAEDVKAVAARLEDLFHSATAMHDLCEERIGNPQEDTVSTFIILRDLLRSAARDLEVCAETISIDHCRLGYFENHFGKI